MSAFSGSPFSAVSVASVFQLSPMRYPGNKTLLNPHIRAWLGDMDPKPRLRCEPLHGGITDLAAAAMDH